MNLYPNWVAALDAEELGFIRKFVLASGSLKEMAKLYGVSYPTVRLRLDRLIQKIQLLEDAAQDPHVALIKQLALNEKLDLDTARLLIQSYRSQQKEESSHGC